MIGSSSQRLFTRVLTGSALLVVALAPVACKKDPTAPPLVAAEDLIMPITAATFAAVSGESFVIPGGGTALGPAFAGQTITVAFTTVGTTPSATITTGSGTIVADVSFGSCVFRVRTWTGPGLIGDVLTINPCALTIGTAGIPTGTRGTTTAVLLAFGGKDSIPFSMTVTVSPTGVVSIIPRSGRAVPAGTVEVTPRTGSGTTP